MNTEDTRAPATIVVAFGTRPEATKLFPVVRALEALPRPPVVRVLCTGQHRELLQDVNHDIRLRIWRDLEVIEPGQPLHQLVAKIIDRTGALFTAEPPDAVIVQGDTVSAMGAGMAAFFAGVPVYHVEAGLRTHDLASPFPEEMSRQVIGRFATHHFAPTEGARLNLLNEGITDAAISVTGNTAVDAVRILAGEPFEGKALGGVPFDTHRVVVTTLHRRENHGERLRTILQQVLDLLARDEGLAFLIPVHPSPAVRATFQAILGVPGGVPCHPRLFLTEPLTYREMIEAMRRCWLVATDSGGLQEEAPTFGKLVLVMRDTTERPEGLGKGISRLMGTDLRTGIEAARLGEFVWPAGAVNPYGDGFAAERIAARIAADLGV